MKLENIDRLRVLIRERECYEHTIRCLDVRKNTARLMFYDLASTNPLNILLPEPVMDRIFKRHAKEIVDEIKSEYNKFLKEV